MGARRRSGVIWLMLGTVALALSGCATVEGVGYDISAGARTVGSWFGR